ncbi:MAG: HlyC/CorC family transporter [Treponema sp.]|nr:HlyC/CorC family transporter [Treponema sp.]
MGSEPPSESFILVLLAAAVCVVLSCVFSASESAFLSLNKLRVHFLREKGDKRATRVGKLLDRKEELLNMLLVANEVVNVALSVLLTALALRLFGPAGLSLSTTVATLLLLVFGEITPKIVTTRHPEPFAFAVSGFITLLSYLLKPFVVVFTAISRGILRIFGINTQSKKVSFTEEEIKTFIDVGGEEGVLELGEKTMMSRVFKFTDLEATDIMIPRKRVISVNPDMSYRDIVQLSERTRLSRFPVIKDDIDDVIGVLYVKDMLFYEGDRTDFTVAKVMRKPLFIVGSTKMSAIQEMLHKDNQSFAIVIDEYSGTDGILTTEDIARQIFGNVADDFQQSGHATDIQIDNLDDFFISGSARLKDFEEILHIRLGTGDSETVAGFVCEKLGRIPTVGEVLKSNGYRFIVTKMDGLRVAGLHCVRENGGAK